MALNIRKGDLVQVISGKDRGVKGKVIEVYPEADRIIVEGVNRIKKHTKVGQNARGAKTGGIITTEAPIHNVILPFTRNVVGPMDYTPVMFADNVYQHLTTYSHELALPVVLTRGVRIGLAYPARLTISAKVSIASQSGHS